MAAMKKWRHVWLEIQEGFQEEVIPKLRHEGCVRGEIRLASQ